MFSCSHTHTIQVNIIDKLVLHRSRAEWWAGQLLLFNTGPCFLGKFSTGWTSARRQRRRGIFIEHDHRIMINKSSHCSCHRRMPCRCLLRSHPKSPASPGRAPQHQQLPLDTLQSLGKLRHLVETLAHLRGY